MLESENSSKTRIDSGNRKNQILLNILSQSKKMPKQKNILQIDVEDWFCDLDISEWDKHENRVLEATNKILKLLKETDNKATFFMLGYVAEAFPELVKKILDQGHEIGTHGYSHTRITNQTPEEFEKDLDKSLKILKKITKEKIWGYRAPQFTIARKTAWAIDILKKKGLKYDSSIFPVKTPLYGVPGAPTKPYRISSEDIGKNSPQETFLEFPLSTFKIPFTKKRIPVAGGFYLRFFPYFFIRYALKKINKKNQPAICYIHPWELDPDNPKIKSLKWYYYFNIKSTEKKFKKLLNDFRFTSTKEWIENAGKTS